MAQYETTGGGIIDSGDKRIERIVVVSTDGSTPTAPISKGKLTNVSITREQGGLSRGIFEYTFAGQGNSSYNAYGKRIELSGGSRELSIYTHPKFATLSQSQIADVQQKVELDPSKNIWSIFDDDAQQRLYNCLRRSQEYFLAPSVIVRITEIETSLPSTNSLCKVASSIGVTAPKNTFWVQTGLVASSNGAAFEVTREYTSVPSVWDDVSYIYNNWEA